MKPVKQALPHSMLPQPAVIDTKPARMPQLPVIEFLQTAGSPGSRKHFDFLHHMSYIIKLRLCVFIKGSNNTDRPYSALSSNSFPTASRQFSTCIALFRAQTALCKTVACVIPQAFSRPIKRHRGPRLESHLTLVPSGTKRPDALWS